MTIYSTTNSEKGLYTLKITAFNSAFSTQIPEKSFTVTVKCVFDIGNLASVADSSTTVVMGLAPNETEYVIDISGSWT